MTEKEETLLTWRVHRLRETPERIPLVGLAYVFALTLWWVFFPYPLALFLPVVALTSALSEFLFPIQYKLTTQGAYANCGLLQRLYLSWEDIKRASHGEDGVFLSPLSRPSRLDNFRGIRLRYAGNRDAVLGVVRQCRVTTQAEGEAATCP